MQSSSPIPSQSNTDTQRGINVRLLAAAAILRELQEIHRQDPTPENWQAVYNAMLKYNALREPMQSLVVVDMPEKRFVELREG